MSIFRGSSILFAVVLLLFATTGCRRKAVELPPLPKEGEKVEVTLYGPASSGLIGVIRDIPKKEYAPAKVLRQLVRQKNALPSREPFKPFLPPGTKILGVKIEDGLATVNFSREVLNVKGESKMMQRHAVAAIVKTLTQFPNIETVKFQVEGRERGKIDERNIEDWWGEVTLREQPWK